jgi:hypothetical protein
MAKSVTAEKYSELLELQIKNGVPYSEHTKGSRKTLIVHNKPFVTLLDGGKYLELGQISDAQFSSFIGTFKKTLYKNISENPELFTKQIKFNGTSRGKNRKSFESVPTESYFWNLDLSSAYWQMGYRLGYVSKKFYEKYIFNDDYKVVKRLCFSFLARSNYKTYTFNNEKYQIECDNTLDQLVYDNIRNELYKIIDGALEIAGDNYVDYNIDAISFTNKARKEVVKYFEEQKLVFKLIPAIKVSPTHYELKDIVRKF